MADDVTGRFEVRERTGERRPLRSWSTSRRRWIPTRTTSPDEFLWAIGAQAPTLLYQLIMTIDTASDKKKSVRVIKLADRRPEGNA